MGVPNPFAEFVDLVAKMRAAQREYFKTRSQEALERSKNLEFQVDELCTHLRRGVRGLPTQGNLFETRGKQ